MYLTRTLAYNRALLDSIIHSGMSWCYDTEIIHKACEAIESELRHRGVC